MCIIMLCFVFLGLRVTYDLSQPVGSRVASVMVRCLECRIPTYSTLKYNHIYSILTSAFLLGGGDGYTMFTEEILSQERFSMYCSLFVFILYVPTNNVFVIKTMYQHREIS